MNIISLSSFYHTGSDLSSYYSLLLIIPFRFIFIMLFRSFHHTIPLFSLYYSHLLIILFPSSHRTIPLFSAYYSLSIIIFPSFHHTVPLFSTYSSPLFIILFPSFHQAIPLFSSYYSPPYRNVPFHSSFTMLYPSIHHVYILYHTVPLLSSSYILYVATPAK
jgi:hypothetical protein